VTKPKEETWPLQDSEKVIERINKIEAAAESLSEFEVKFLTEVLRQATRFRENFRMTPKQVRVLAELETKILLPGRLAAKVRKPKAAQA